MLSPMKSVVRSVMCCATACFVTSQSRADDTPRSAAYFSVGTTVTNQERFSGRLAVEGHPVILVKADLPDTPWWVQEPVEMLSKKLFRARGRFGNAKTPPRTKFHLVALVLPDANAAAAYKPGQQVRSLPVDMPRSAIVRLSLIRSDAEAETVTVDPASPKTASQEANSGNKEAEASEQGKVLLTHSIPKHVSRVQELKFKSSRTEEPRVLVRAVGKGNLWWVQRVPAKKENNQFAVHAIFGNAQTQDGHQFQVVIVFPPSGDMLPIGSSLKSLPASMPQSPTISVERGSAPEQTATNVRE